MDLRKDLAEFDEVGEAIAAFLMPVIEAARADKSEAQEWPAKGPWRKLGAAKFAKPEKN